MGIQSEKGPSYEVHQKSNSIEIRQYDTYLIAETQMQNESKESRSKAFRVLAGYIFGKNKHLKTGEPEKIPMTSPVVQSKKNSEYKMSFMMPNGSKIESLPQPLVDSIKFRTIEESLMATIQFSGHYDSEKFALKETQLTEWLKSNSKYKIVSGPYYASYNPPWTLPFFKRNEVQFRIEKKD